MPKSTSPAPKVFVVPDLMASGPAEAGALLKEHLEAERARRRESPLRERIEAYLRDPGVARKPAEETWPSAMELARMSGVERQRWMTWEAQQWMDASLKKILIGKSPRDVFKLEAKTKERPTRASRDRNLCAEVLRLMERCDYSKTEAMRRVAKVFAVAPPVVEKAAELWSWDAQGKKERHRFVPLWEQKLRSAGRLK